MRGCVGKRGENLSRFSLLLSIAAGIVMAGFLLWLGWIDNIDLYQSREDSGFEVVEESVCREIEDVNAPAGIRKEYVFSLGRAIPRDTSFAFYTVHQNVEVFLDGECIYRMEPAKEMDTIKTAGSNWAMIPLYREDAGKEIRVVITPVYESFRDREITFLMGSRLSIYRYRLAKDLPQFILGIMAVFVGLVFLCVAAYNVVKKKRGRSMIGMGLFSAMMGVWRLTDTRFTPFILPEKPVFLFNVSICMLMLGMIPLMKWLQEYFEEEGRRILDVSCSVVALAWLVQVMLQVCGILDLRETLSLTHILIGAGAVVIIGIAVYERKKYPWKPILPEGGRLAFLLVAGILGDVVAFYIKGNSSGLLFSLMAFLLYIVFLGIVTMYNYSEQEMRLVEQERQLAQQEKELAEQEKELVENRISIMVSQIQPHFLYNSLNTIYHLCDKDGKMAKQAISDFSEYLRHILGSVNRTTPVPFEEEMQHVKTYLGLEKMRFGEDLNVEYHIEASGFFVPALSVQPLVENAVKHGILGKEEGGTLILSTKEYASCFEIIISDDGVGFVPDKEPEDGKLHVGIQNVRQRLRHMCDGTLTIESIPGEGTTATIRLPKEVEDENISHR